MPGVTSNFLQVLCEDEIARRDTAALARRVRRARFEQHSTFEDFDFAVSPKLPAAMLRDLAALRWLEAGESVILYGLVGVGKTHVAQALGHKVAQVSRIAGKFKDEPGAGAATGTAAMTRFRAVHDEGTGSRPRPSDYFVSPSARHPTPDR